jgi:hypothetical protein
MTAIAAFDLITDLTTENLKTNLIELWVYKSVDILFDPTTKLTTCILEYIFYRPEEEESIRSVISYLLDISKNNYIYYYPSWDAYSGDEGDEDIEISVDDIFTETYMLSICGWGMKFLIRK